MDTYFDGVWRMDWGLGNPNTTAVLIACLMIATWSIALAAKRGFWIALVLSTGLAWCLVETYSRGGMIAFLCGTAVLGAWTPRPWPKAKLVGVTIAFWFLGAFVLCAKAQMRYGQGLFSEDASIGNRLAIWRQVPEMIAAAPWGWGWGRAGDAYTQWFQPADQSVNYLNLINSHFNFMVEAGWLGAALYLFAWRTAILLCWPAREFRMKAIPLAVWATFGIGACFSDVANLPCLWALPLGALICAMGERYRLARWPRVPFVATGGAASVFIVAVLALAGSSTTSLPICYERGVVTIGTAKNSTVIFVDRTVMGSLYGHAFRRYLARDPGALRDRSFVFVESAGDLPLKTAAQIVVSGRFIEEVGLAARLNSASRVILVNPSGFPDDAPLSRDVQGRTTVFFGEYAQTPARASWSSLPGVKAIQINGAADFVPSWPEAIWTAPQSRNL